MEHGRSVMDSNEDQECHTNAAKQATRIERATRYGSYVPVTTIGIAPILTRAYRATNPPTHLEMQPTTFLGYQ